MKAVVQRVAYSKVIVEGEIVATIDDGLLVLLGVGPADDATIARRLAAKVVGLRVFCVNSENMNSSVIDIGGAVLCVSQFTLFADVRRGNRPSFSGAANPVLASELYEAFCAEIAARGVPCERGVFGADMEVELLNNGPVTLLLDTADWERPRRAPAT